ncbi:hypothetical protein TruAng_009417 [Truncatella angustata]|nr:hypothetical protein TruAng_009417 [Truncatella angustata]
MNDLVVQTNAPASILPSQTYASADEWYRALADMHISQLAFQHNNAVEDEGDARDKYAAERRPASEPESEGGFTRFSEDFRPANILLDKDLWVVGVIDWQFAHAAVTQFSFDLPWWLLLEEPEYWTGGYRAWVRRWWLQTSPKKVGRLSPAGDGKTEVPLSQRMRESREKRA